MGCLLQWHTVVGTANCSRQHTRRRHERLIVETGNRFSTRTSPTRSIFFTRRSYEIVISRPTKTTWMGAMLLHHRESSVTRWQVSNCRPWEGGRRVPLQCDYYLPPSCALWVFSCELCFNPRWCPCSESLTTSVSCLRNNPGKYLRQSPRRSSCLKRFDALAR